MPEPSRPEFVDNDLALATIFDHIHSYLLNQKYTPSETAGDVISILKPLMNSRQNLDYVFYLWGSIFHLAKSSPPKSTHQDRLLDLITAIRSAPPLSASSEMIVWRRHVSIQTPWKGMLGWQEVWETFEADAPLDPRMEELEHYQSPEDASRDSWAPVDKRLQVWRSHQKTAMSGEEWRNLNSLLARVHAIPLLGHEAPVMDVDYCGLAALREALEEELSLKGFNDLLPAASEWILQAGKEILLNNNESLFKSVGPDIGLAKRTPWSRGVLFDGPMAFSRERWEFWKGRFAVLSEREDLDEDTRTCAVKARDEMIRTEEHSKGVDTNVIN